jgi:tetratricopeptide (TPR) repeat protein
MKRIFRRIHAWQLWVLAAGLGRAAFGDGLPGEYLISQRWHELFLAHSALANPAFLSEENYATLRAAYSMPMQGSFQLWETGLTVPIGFTQSMGISWAGLSSGPIAMADWAGGDQGVLSNSTSAYQSNFFMLSYALCLKNRFGLGANLNLAYDNVFGHEQRISIPPGLDLGFSYRLLRDPTFGWHLVGITLQNLVAPTMKSATLGDEVYSRNLRMSWLGSYYCHKIFTNFVFDLKDFLAQAEEFTSGNSPKTEYGISLAGGGWILNSLKLSAQSGIGNKMAGYWGLAAGVNVPSFNLGRDLEVLYQFNSMFQGKGTADHTIYVRAELGMHREEIYARMMARLLDSSPNDLYNKALRLYYAGKYWEAFYVFGQILSQYPDFFKNDWVQYYFGSCQEELDMRTAGKENYQQVSQEYGTSDAIPNANLGIMRIAYRNKNYNEVAEQFSKLNQPGIRDSLKCHAFYVMGESWINEKEFQKAKQVLDMIPEDHPDYIFAQHSLGVASMNINDTAKAAEAFMNAIAAKPQSAEQGEVANRSCLLIGYLFLEQGALPKAVTALRKVPVTSAYYPDALLGLGWAAAKARNWVDCAEASDQLIKVANKEILRCEAMLLKSFTDIMKKDYAAAGSILREAEENIGKLHSPSEDSLAQLEKVYTKDRSKYDSISVTAQELALSRRSALVQAMVDSLHSPQTRTKEKIDEFLRAVDDFARTSILFKTLKETKSGIEYASVTAKRLQAYKKVEKNIKETQEIGQEIEKLKEEMRQKQEMKQMNQK